MSEFTERQTKKLLVLVSQFDILLMDFEVKLISELFDVWELWVEKDVIDCKALYSTIGDHSEVEKERREFHDQVLEELTKDVCMKCRSNDYSFLDYFEQEIQRVTGQDILS